jgi:hypothetical protein
MVVGVGVSVGSNLSEARASAGDNYNLVKNVSDLAAGDEILFGYTNGSDVHKASGALNANSGSYLKAEDATISNEVLKYTGTSVKPLTLGKSGNNWTFTYGTTTVATTAAKKMCISTTANSVSTWTISITTAGVATIKSTTSSYGAIKYNTSSPRFLNYASGQASIGIYKKASSTDTLNSVNIATSAGSTQSATSGSVEIGKTLQLYLTANWAVAGPKNVTTDAVWTIESADQAYATVNEGLITGRSQTSSAITLTATYGGKSATFSLSVVVGPSVTTTPSTSTSILVNEYKETALLVTASNFDGGDPTITATSSNDSLLLTDIITKNNKTYVALQAGEVDTDTPVTVTVSATGGGRTETHDVTVTIKAMSVSLSTNPISLLPTAGATNFALTVENFASGYTVAVESSNTAVFTTSVSQDLSTVTVTPVSEGEEELYITVSNGSDRSKVLTVPVTIADVVVYEKITDASKLTSGSKLLIVYETGSVAMGAQGNDLRTYESVSIAGSKITGPSSAVKVVTLGGEADNWTLSTDEGYLSYSGSSNKIFTVSELANSCYWSISITNGDASIESNNVSGRYLQYNSGSPRFACYTGTQNDVQLYGIVLPDKKVVDTKLTTTDGSITASVGANKWTVSGFVFEVKYEGESSWNTVEPTYVVSESVPTSYSSLGEYPVHFKVTFKDTDYYQNTPFTATVTDDMTPISSFYDGTIPVSSEETTNSYTYRGTVIAIEGNTYYIQDGNYGMMVYGGNKTYPSEMKVGDLVAVTSKIVNYQGYVYEASNITLVDGYTCRILGDGTLPTAPIVSTVADFNAANQSTRITFNGLKRSDLGTSITWAQTWSQGSKGAHGIAQVKDRNGTSIWLYVSKFLTQEIGSAIVSKINSITTEDTFDLFQGVKAINTTDFTSIGGPAKGVAYLSIMSADNITIHTPEEDHVQTWIDLYMQMNNPDFDGDGSGACKDSNYYVNAKAALNALETEHPGSKASFQSESKYADALERYLKWAKACGDSKPFVGSTIQQSIVNSLLPISESNSTTIITIIVSVIGVSALGGFFFLRKRKEI